MRAVRFVDSAGNGRAVLAASLARALHWEAFAGDDLQTPEAAEALSEIGLGVSPPGVGPEGALVIDVVPLRIDGAGLGLLGGADDFERRVNARLVRDRLSAALGRLAPP